VSKIQEVRTNVQEVKEVQPFDKEGFLKECVTKSNAIRKLTALGHERKVVAKMLGIRYQHVRNVLITPIKNPKVAVK